MAPNMITSQNVADIIAEDAELLEALFPEHHESIPNVSFPYMIDLNGDGIEEKLEITDLRYNGGDGGYALTVTDTKTGNKIPLPDGYTEESGFPIRTFYMQQEEEAQLLVQLGRKRIVRSSRQSCRVPSMKYMNDEACTRSSRGRCQTTPARSLLPMP